MSRNTNKIESIEQIKKRGAHWTDVYSAAHSVELQLQSLIDAADAAPEHCLELWKYFPIAAVTCLENSTRWAVNYLVECGEDYKERAITQLVAGQFSMKDLMPLLGRRITLGDLVAHLVSINSLQDINSHLSVLMGKDLKGKSRDFLGELKGARSFDSTMLDFPDKVSGQQDVLLLPEPNVTIPAIKRIFDRRHIIVHELTPPDICNPGEMKTLLVHTAQFIQATRHFILELGHPGSTAMYQTSMNIGAGLRYDAAQQEMDQVLDELDQRLGSQSKKKQAALRVAQRQYMRFLEAEARLYLNPFEGGSAAPMMAAGHRTYLVQFRTQQLKEHLEYVIDPEAAYMGTSSAD